jgi:hypothetical protein
MPLFALQVTGLLLLVGALTNHLKRTLTVSAVLMIVGLGFPSLFYLHPNPLRFAVILGLAIASGAVLLWGVWGGRLRNALIVLGLLLIGYGSYEIAPFAHQVLSVLLFNPAVFFVQMAVLLVGVVLLVGAWSNQIQWALAIAGVLFNLLR